jgi:radical SAM superfamily enzyme
MKTFRVYFRHAPYVYIPAASYRVVYADTIEEARVIVDSILTRSDTKLSKIDFQVVSIQEDQVEGFAAYVEGLPTGEYDARQARQ